MTFVAVLDLPDTKFSDADVSMSRLCDYLEALQQSQWESFPKRFLTKVYVNRTEEFVARNIRRCVRAL